MQHNDDCIRGYVYVGITIIRYSLQLLSKGKWIIIVYQVIIVLFMNLIILEKVEIDKRWNKITFQKTFSNRTNMPRSNIKYEIARDDPDSMDYYLQHVQEYKTTSKIHKSFWNIFGRSLVLIAIYFPLSVGLTFYQQWLLHDYVSTNKLTILN